MSKQDDLQAIIDDIIKNNVTPELRDGATQLVFADGNPDAEIVFIGEAPGKNEDEQGVPFVGAAGKFLNEMLESIGLKRADIYITNIVKYRPPNNRDPEPDEKKAFWPYSVRQLDVIQPKLVVTLGRHSMEYFLPGQKIGAIHGEPKRIRVKRHESRAMTGSPGESAMQESDETRTESYKNTLNGESQSLTKQRAASSGGAGGSANSQADTTWVILPLYHPAAALYNGGQRQMLIDDFSKIPAILKKIKEINKT